jgi:hypothetical protein
LYSTGATCEAEGAVAGKKARIPAGSAIYLDKTSVSMPFTIELAMSILRIRWSGENGSKATHRTPKRSQSLYISNAQAANHKHSRPFLDLIFNESL